MTAGRHHSDYRFLSNIALADIAFVARGDSLPALFESAARALMAVMVDGRTVVGRVERTIEISSPSIDRLLYDFLTELIVIKDVDSLLFKALKVTIRSGPKSEEQTLTCVMRGEEIDRERHALRNDVKAVTMHMFGVNRRREELWERRRLGGDGRPGYLRDSGEGLSLITRGRGQDARHNLTEVIKNAKQVSDVVWEIPPSYKAGMNVPARIYATKNLLEAMDNGVIEQVTNVASLPGIVKYSYAMADAHWGYGFPIGGVAAFDPENGIISPGGIGFDINCLHPDSRIYDENGIWRRIGSEAPPMSFTSYDESSHSMLPTKAVMQQQRWERESILKLRTRLGKALLVTADHPVRTRRGMVLAGQLSMEDSLLVSGVEGIPFTEPLPIELVSPDSLNTTMERMGISDRGNSRAQVLAALRSRGLDRLKLNDPTMAQLTKLLGFIFGDGNIPRVKKGQYVTLWGKAVDLEGIKRDLMNLGFGSHRSTRERHHKINTFYGTSEFDFIEESLQVSSTAFAVLMVALGAPYGKKTNQAYHLPEWLFSAEDWQKKLFLGAFFGAELLEADDVERLRLPDALLQREQA